MKLLMKLAQFINNYQKSTLGGTMAKQFVLQSWFFHVLLRHTRLSNQFRKHCQFKQRPLRGDGEIFNISGKGGREAYMGGLGNLTKLKSN